MKSNTYFCLFVFSFMIYTLCLIKLGSYIILDEGDFLLYIAFFGAVVSEFMFLIALMKHNIMEAKKK